MRELSNVKSFHYFHQCETRAGSRTIDLYINLLKNKDSFTTPVTVVLIEDDELVAPVKGYYAKALLSWDSSRGLAWDDSLSTLRPFEFSSFDCAHNTV